MLTTHLTTLMNEQKNIILSALAVPLIWMASLHLFFLLPLTVAEDFKWFISGTLGTLLVLIITYPVARYNGVTMDQIGLNWTSKTPIRLLYGLLIGTAIAGVMLSAIVQLTELQLNRDITSDIPMALFFMLAILPMAFMEEVAFRGFVFFRLNGVIGLRSTIIITSILFAYYHDMTGASFITQLLGPGIWGIIYGLSAIWSRGLAVPTGIHVGANVVLNAFGLKDSNNAIWMIDYPADISERDQAYTEMIGLYGQLVLLVVGVLLIEWYLKKRRVLPEI